MKKEKKKVFESHQKSRNVTLSDEAIKLAKEIGYGNASLGIRIALMKFEEEENRNAMQKSG